MQIVGPAPEALSNEQIIKRYDSAITEVIKAGTDPQFDYERTILLNSARLAWMFVKGQHFNVPGQVTTPFGEIIDYQPFDITNGSDETGPDVRLCPPINVLGGDLFKFMSIMGATAPRVRAVADDQMDPDSLDTAHNADVQIRDIWAKNKIDKKWKALAFHQYTTGPCYLRGVWNTDARKYGQTTEPQIEVIAGPDGSPVPQVVGQQTYSNGDAELRTYSVLEVAHDYDAKELEECGFFKLELMRSKWDIIAEYPGKGEDEDGNPLPGPFDQYRLNDIPDDERTASSITAAEAVDAVLALRPARLGDVAHRLSAVRAFAALPEAAALAAANKRISNILKKVDGGVQARVDVALLKEPAEQALQAALHGAQPVADGLYATGEYAASLRELAVLKGPVDAFFEGVMVNAEDAALRANRLGLLATLHAAMNRVADLSRLAT